MSAKGPGVVMPPTLPFLAGFAAGLWWNHSDPWLMQSAGDNGLRMVAGTLITGAGAALFWTGLWTFVRQRTGILLQQPATRIVTSGPYRWSRNPQYVVRGDLPRRFNTGQYALAAGPAAPRDRNTPLAGDPARRGLHAPHVSRRVPQYCQRVHRWL